MFERGMRTRRAVLGDEHVDRATVATTDLDRDFQRWITEVAWGSVWSRPGLDRRTRSLVTIAILAALDREELGLHLRAAARTGASWEEIAETLLHVGVYAGLPAANAAFGEAKRIMAEAAEGDPAPEERAQDAVADPFPPGPPATGGGDKGQPR
jgi:4-carboxymuconolactone decarboxylase